MSAEAARAPHAQSRQKGCLSEREREGERATNAAGFFIRIDDQV